MRTGQEIVPNTKLPHAANFLHMLLGLEPSQEDAEVIDTTFVLYADHDERVHVHGTDRGLDARRHVLRDHRGDRGPQGPLARGGQRESMKMLEEVGSPDRAEAYVRDRLDRHRR